MDATARLWRAKDFSGEIPRQAVINLHLELGQFSFSQQDLGIPASRIPLTVVRTHNSIITCRDGINRKVS